MPGADDPSPLRSHWPVAVLALAAAVVAVLAHQHVFPALSWNRDEPVYLWNVEVLRQGQLTATDGGHPNLFLPWLSATRDGTMFTQYTLGWPLVLLAARTVTGTAAAALPFGAALSVVGTYAFAFELTQRRRLATLAAALLVASPILAIQGGVYLSYLFTLGIGLSAGALLLSGFRRQRPLRVVAAGVLVGWIFLTRPYDALLWGAAFAVGLLLTAGPRRGEALKALVVTALSALPLVVVTLLYNRHVTGDPLTFPITVADPLDGFGFGTRRLMPGFEEVDYDVASALRSSAKNGVLLPWFLVGGYLGAIVAMVGLWQQRRRPVATFALLVGAVFPLGYFVFWGTYLSSLAARISGPIYLIPLYALVCILAAAALDRWWDDRRPLAWAVLGVLVVATLPGAVSRFAINREISLEQDPWRQSVEDLPDGSLVFVVDTGSYLLYSNPFSSNGPALDDDVLYASAGSPSMLDLIAERPDRVPYLQEGSIPAPELGPREDPYDLDVTVTPIEVERGEALELEITLAPPPGSGPLELVVDTGADTLRTTVDAATTAPLRVVLGDGGPGSLRVDDRGEVTVTATPTEAGDGRAPVRRITPYRHADGELELLTPWTAQRREQLDEDTAEWRHVPAADDLLVEVTPA